MVMNGGSDGEGGAGGSAFYSYAILSSGFPTHLFFLSPGFFHFSSLQVPTTHLFFSLCKLSLPGVDQLPENVDPGKREEFLTDAEFVEVSGVGVFYGIPFYWN